MTGTSELSTHELATRTTTLDDGTHRCQYRQLPRLFDGLDRHMDTRGMGTADPLIFGCGNRLADAVLLLWLLARGRDFLLVPPALVEQKGPETSAPTLKPGLPLFFRYIIRAKPGDDTLDIETPATFVEILDNPCYSDQIPEKAQTGGHVYFRTSGSTADPKLVRHRVDRLVGNALNCVDRFGLVPDDRVLIPVPLYHMYGFGAGFLPAVLAGAAVTLLANTNILTYLDRERAFAPSVAFVTPTLCEMLLRARKGGGAYRLAVTAGDRINPATYLGFEDKFGPLVNLYGSTELGAIAVTPADDPPEVRSDGMVAPLNGVRLRLGPGPCGGRQETGEIRVCHPHGFDAYVDARGREIDGAAPEWYPTKDLGKIPANHRLKVVGRLGGSINRNGILVAFAEVESIMEQRLEEIQHVVVVGLEGEDRYRGKQMAALCTLKKQISEPTDAKALRGRCMEIMMRHLVPDRIVITDEIPRLPNGKFDRKKAEQQVKK